MGQSRRFWLLSILVLLFVFLGGYTLLAWTPLPVDEDPLVHMPGTQPAEVTTLEGPNRCFNCHAGFDEAVEPGFNWMGSMMAQSARDFLFWACFTVAGQDSIWALGNPNAGDICERCHFPQGWLEGRSDPPNASAMTGVDYDGVQCDFCHNMYNPFFEETHNWAREGDLNGDGTVDESEWEAYWDETNDSGTPSATAAATTYAADAALAETITFFNGEPFYGSDNFPVYSSYTENAAGQYFVSPDGDKRASFTDATGRHAMLYSRYHKSRDFCSTCHDVSNPALANLGQDGTAPLTTEMEAPYSYYHVERTFSEFMLSDYGQDGGSPGIGPYAPEIFVTSRLGNAIATCQDCHMPDAVGKASSMSDAVVRPIDSVEHPQSGQPVHDLTGGNMWVGYILASSVPKSPNHDAVNEALLDQGPDALTLDLGQGDGLDPEAILAGADRAYQQLLQAAAIEDLAYDPVSGAITFRVQNQTGHKLISGFPEGRRMFVGVKIYAGGELVYEVNPYDASIGTLKGIPVDYSHSSPPLADGESYLDELVYELHPSSTLTGESSSFHFALADGRYKDNRIPPKGFRIADAPERLSEPVWHGMPAPGYYTADEYSGGYDAVDLTDYGIVVPGADRVEVRLQYQTTSREYVEFLRDEINGDQNQTLPSTAYIIQTDPFFDQLRAWGDTIWQLWEHNKDLPGAAPILMTEASVDMSMATVSFSSPTYAASELGGSAIITVTRSDAIAHTATVQYATSDGTAGSTDYTAVSGLLSFLPGVTEQAFTIPILDDNLVEGDETVLVSLSDPVNAKIGTGTAVLTITDDEAEPTLSIADASASEGAGTMIFYVTLSSASTLGVSVDWSTSDGPAGPGGAITGEDYTGGSGTLEIAPGSTQGEIHVPILQDTVYEGSEVFAVELSNPVNAGLVDGLGQGTIDDDDSVPVVSFDGEEFAVDEHVPDGSVAITVTLTGATVLTATVNYATSDGTAGAADYTAVSGTLIFTPGVVTQTFSVPIVDDALDELDESVYLTLSEPDKAELGISSAQLTIIDNEGEPTLSISDASASENAGTMVFHVTLSYASEVDVSVDWSTSDGPAGPGGALAGSDYTGGAGILDILAGSTQGEITIPILQDSFYEGSEILTVGLSNPTHVGLTDALGEGTIVDDESPPVVAFGEAEYAVDEDAAEGFATISLSLTGDTVITATVNYETSDGTAEPADYTAVSGTLVFTPGVSTRTFAVPITDDGRDEPDESVLLTLSEPVSATLGTSSAQLTIVDDDLPPEISIDDVSMMEADGTMLFSVSLSVPSEFEIQVSYTTSNGTDPSSATAGIDYAAASDIMSIPAGTSTASIGVGILHDLLYELDETFEVTLSNAVNATLLDAEATGTIRNNDEPPQIEFEAALFSVGEEDGTVILTVTLSGPTALAATVNYATSDGPVPAGAKAGEDYIQASGTITFLPGETSNTTALTILGDAEPEVTETFVVTLFEPAYSTIGSNVSALVQIVDDDAYRTYLPLVVRSASP
jgi:hypothetical protein